MASFADLNISKETPFEEMAIKLVEYWKLNSFVEFVKFVGYTMKPLLLTKGLPNDTYKDFLSYFLYHYKEYPKAFITTLFQTALEENAISGVLRIVANKHDYVLVKEKSSEKVFIDSNLLKRLKELNSIVPLILNEGIRVYGTQAKNAVISNTIINMLNAKRPDDNPLKRLRDNNASNNTNKLQNKIKYARQGGTRKKSAKLKVVRRRKTRRI